MTITAIACPEDDNQGKLSNWAFESFGRFGDGKSTGIQQIDVEANYGSRPLTEEDIEKAFKFIENTPFIPQPPCIVEAIAIANGRKIMSITVHETAVPSDEEINSKSYSDFWLNRGVNADEESEAKLQAVLSDSFGGRMADLAERMVAEIIAIKEPTDELKKPTYKQDLRKMMNKGKRW